MEAEEVHHSRQSKSPSSSAEAERKPSSGPTQYSLEVIVILLLCGIVLGLLWRELMWPALPKNLVVRIIFTTVLFVALFILVACYLCRKATTGKVLKNACMTIVVLIIALSAVVPSLVLGGDFSAQFLRIFAILFFSLIPAWLYMQFVWTKSSTLWDEYVANLFRLHIDHYRRLPEPSRDSYFYKSWSEQRKRFGQEEEQRQKTEAREGQGFGSHSGPSDDNLYRKKFEAVFGPWAVEGRLTLAVLNFRDFFPLAVLTLVVSVGWVFVMLKLPASSQLSSGPRIVTELTSQAVSRESFRFGFLGAYFFILQMLVRRYFQSDLKTDAYINATIRIIIVTLLVWVVVQGLFSVSSPDMGTRDEQTHSILRSAIPYMPTLAFVIGVFPVLGWQIIQAIVSLAFKRIVLVLKEQYPLSELDGLNIWYESRFLEEGIEDMQNLATANLVDVMLNTRIPINRLVDWVDQSLLYLHLGEKDTDYGKRARGTLRPLGVRTATDLEDLIQRQKGSITCSETVEGVKRVLNPKDSAEPNILECIHATLKDEPNLIHVQAWKSFPSEELEKEPTPDSKR